MTNKIEKALQNFLSFHDESELAFLTKLDADEQLRLAALFQKRLEDEGGALFATIGMVANFIPTFFMVKVAQETLSPNTVAKIAAYMPVKKAVAAAKSMRMEFLAEVAPYSQPETLVEMIEALPDKMLVDISRILLAKGHYRTLGGFADHLTAKKLKIMIDYFKENIIDILEIAQCMKNQQRMIEITESLSDDYLLKLMQGISQLEYYALATKIAQKLDIRRQSRLMLKLDASDMAKLSQHYPVEVIAQVIKLVDRKEVELMAEATLQMQPEKVVEIVEVAPDSLLVDVSRLLLRKGYYQKLGEFADHLSAAKLKTLADHFQEDIKDILEVANCMKNQQRLLEVTAQYDDAYLLKLMQGISQLGYYELAGKVGQELGLERQTRLLVELDAAEAARIAAHYPVEIIAKIMAQVSVELAVEIGLRMDNQILGSLFNHLPVDLINQFIPYFPPSKLLACLPYVNLKKIENHLAQTLPAVKTILRELSKDYPPLQALMK